jgi:hypothetical protein
MDDREDVIELSAYSEVPVLFDSNDAAVKPICEVFEEIIAEVPAELFESLPRDGASEHDHYLYGTPKRNETPIR